jgi:prevent-host-death family protein
MEQVGIRALQQHASEVVRRVAGGEVVEVTDRGRPVARLVPVSGSRLEAWCEAGLARKALLTVSDLGMPLRWGTSGPRLSDLLERARTNER